MGGIFVSRQNKILTNQNKILSEQTLMMENQKELNSILIKSELDLRDERDTEDTLIRILEGHLTTDKEVDSEVERLMKKPLTKRQLMLAVGGLHANGRIVSNNGAKILDSYERVTRAQIAAKVKLPAPVETG